MSYITSEETKKKISETMKKIMQSPEARKRSGEKNIGKTPWNKGKTGFTPWNKGKTGLSGEKNGNYRGGPPCCPDCGKLNLHYIPGRCRQCYYKHNRGENHYAWKGGTDEISTIRTSAEYQRYNPL